MNQLQFLERILPPLPAPGPFGNPSVYYTLGLRNGETPIQVSFGSVQTVAGSCEYLSSIERDTYVSLFYYKDVLQGRRGHNAGMAKALWVDLDAGKAESVYPTAMEALTDLARFVNETGLEPTIIVSSGMGLHVYWVLDEAVEAGEWLRLARGLNAKCEQHRLVNDAARTVDLASIPRVPGSTHSKTGNTVTVLAARDHDWAVDNLAEKLGVCRGCDDTPELPVLVPEVEPSDPARPVVLQCPQVLSMGLADYEQWVTAMSVLRQCVDGLEWAHKLSAMDPARYTEYGTEEKFNSMAANAPARCCTFEMYNARLCQECKHRGRISTPLQLSRTTMEEIPPPVPVVSTPIPAELERLVIPDRWEYSRVALNSHAFKVDERGIVWVQSEKDQMAPGGWRIEEKVICASQLYYKHSVLRMEDMRPQRSHIFEVVHPNGKREELRFIIDEDMSTYNIMKWFNNGNMFPCSGAYTAGVFMSFMNAYLQSVTAVGHELSTYDLFGWNKFTDPVTKQESIGFVTGAGMVSASGIHDIAFGGKTRTWAAKSFTHKGDLDAWKSVPKMYTTLDQKIGELAFCFGLAAPFMKYGAGEAKNCILNIWSNKSGLGKTQILRGVASMWGDPYKSFFTKDESVVARARRLTVWNHIPAMMDELTDMPDEHMSNLAFLLINGNEKGKLKSSGAEFVETGDWSTCTFATANKSFKACLAKTHGDTDATLQRVMEFECEFPSYAHMPPVQKYIDECIRVCEENYGLAGPEFIYQMLQYPERFVTLTRQVEAWVSKNGFKNDERFMSHPLGLAIKCGRWAVEYGILDFDMDALEKWALEVFVPHNRTSTKEWSPHFADTLAVYLNEQAAQNTIVTTTEDRLPDQPDPKVPGQPDKFVVRLPLREITVRYCQTERRVYWSVSDFNAWCAKKNIGAHSLIKSLKSEGLDIGKAHVNLGKHVSYIPTSRMRCYKLEMEDVNRLGFDPIGE